MNIKYVSLFALLFVTVAHGITSDQTLNVVYSQYARAHQAYLKCQQSKDFWGRPSQCINEKNILATKSDEYNKVTMKMKEYLNTTVQEGNEATLFEPSKKTKAKMAREAIKTLTTCEQQTDSCNDLSMLLWESSNNFTHMPWDKETRKQFHHDLYRTIPN